MFQVGDKVFCPMRGTGIVEVIEERSMLDEVKEYVVIELKSSKSTVMIPKDRIDNSNFRHISNVETANEVLAMLGDKAIKIAQPTVLKERMKANKEKLASGRLIDYGQVIKGLTSMQKEKALNAGENTILMEARKFLVDEISMIKSISFEEANTILDDVLA